MTAPVAGELIFAEGLPKLAWLKTLPKLPSSCRISRSFNRKSFINPRSRLRMCGPDRMVLPALPKRPTLAGLLQTGFDAGQPGTANAPRLIQLAILWPLAGITLTPGITSGRPPILFVLDGSVPWNRGV